MFWWTPQGYNINMSAGMAKTNWQNEDLSIHFPKVCISRQADLEKGFESV